jgi:hypothetical protein
MKFPSLSYPLSPEIFSVITSLPSSKCSIVYLTKYLSSAMIVHSLFDGLITVFILLLFLLLFLLLVPLHLLSLLLLLPSPIFSLSV